ncbi:MAG: FAD-dependent oxidoreductase [Bacteroidales bacterium]|jgi:hypothetical protein|nr:FAD-dependent oxidoreductase [Bacteroidales bacterium]
MKRRTAIKNIGALSVACSIPAVLDAKTENAQSKVPTQETDILVVGGGTAGVIAAIQAARAGCKTILVENGSWLGGTMTTGGVTFPGIFHAWGRQVIGGIGWELVEETVTLGGGKIPDFTIPPGRQHWRHQVHINGPLYALIAEEKCLQAGVTIRYYETPVQIKMKNGKWHVDVVGKGTHYRIICDQLVDCTGNALVVSMCGFHLIREEEIQPGSLIFELGGYDVKKLDPDDLNKRFKQAIADGTLLKTDAYSGIMSLLNAKGGLATQHVMDADSTTSRTHTQTNIRGRESMLRIIRFVRSLPGCENAYISKMQPETSIRETNRIDGIYQVTHDDYVEGRVFEDSLSYSFYPIDLHIAEGVRPKHLQEGKVATVPLRALVPKNSKNLIVAGRCVSSDRLANSALRVQASCMGMGQVAGAAAALACLRNTTPLGVPIPEIKKILENCQAIVP